MRLQGRNQLGTAVTQSAYVRAAYSAIRSMKDGTYYTEIYHKDFKYPLKMKVRAKTGDKNLRSFRECLEHLLAYLLTLWMKQD